MVGKKLVKVTEKISKKSLVLKIAVISEVELEITGGNKI